MFSILIAGRLPQINFQQVSETQFVIPVSDVDNVNHLVVFMTGQIPFPENFGGGGNWPSTESPSWIYLGKITNTKPSAIFKINKIKDIESKISSSLVPSLFSGFQHQTAIPTDGLLGISVEPLTQLEQQIQPHDITPSTVASNVEFVSKMLNNFVNYVTSFVQNVPGTSEQIVPLSIIQTWYSNFQRRMAENPNFWK
ncbi:unnamed protein product [Rotaria sordida]|uniref:Hikeshi-like domain-containing protein n=1 Tax=Rotaria sordida TaxID=392033 RepID=A0A819A9I3_9BILA|nr:unnamed protein product [Rotaria sordida]CAF1247996.1 unnamed protein product [Rotaria sordida]CAF1529368.1 unnamed protein product [Rotaria sordida]CAF1529499.1 unnamed protein product [Rotaria sordida]CAF3780128.1 unnamed protein product [Rotaria sordida]